MSLAATDSTAIICLVIQNPSLLVRNSNSHLVRKLVNVSRFALGPSVDNVLMMSLTSEVAFGEPYPPRNRGRVST
jgi:hypothetical protein